LQKGGGMKMIDETLDGGGGRFVQNIGLRKIRPELVLDLSRLISRILHPAPTGVDRVEMAYARGLLDRAGHRTAFAAVHPSGVYGRLCGEKVRAFIDHTVQRWERYGTYENPVECYHQALRWLWHLRPGAVTGRTGNRVLIQPSPNHLDRPRRMAAKIRREQSRFICLVHDVIPVSHPEYARPGGGDCHQRRLNTIVAQADGVLVNSQATFHAFMQRSGMAFAGKPVRVAPLGVEPVPRVPAPMPSARPYFVILGTIEPRKNHLLLLWIWRDLCERLGPAGVPQLLIIGRRGWENENVIDMLDRCAVLHGVVRELDRLPDQELRAILAGAQALLMPSFAEGFGLPIAEALAAGIPVIASDLAVHRETGGDVPDYIDPLDGPAWKQAVLAYADPGHARRRAQIDRMAAWSPTPWDSHIDAVLNLADEVVAC
jgi:glycosyltransferase involved in cell wall biosynthesis